MTSKLPFPICYTDLTLSLYVNSYNYNWYTSRIDRHYIGDSGLHELVWWRNHLSSLATCIGLNLQLKGVEKPLKHNLANEFSRLLKSTSNSLV